MATGRPISPWPTESATKYPPRVQPNAHPYPIKTTSSALLSRSTTSPHSAHHTKHHYVPPPPSRIPRVRHNHSSSLSLVEGELYDINGMRATPPPLPTPPSADLASLDDSSASLQHADQPKPKHRVRRAETMPSSATAPISTGNHSCNQFALDWDSRLDLRASLPPNPRQWNTDELVTYLETALKSLRNTANGDGEDSGVVNILQCVRTRGLTGRALLRLTDADLTDTPLSDVQRIQLLEHSRSLRADVLRGRISADHSQRLSDMDDTQFPCSAPFSIDAASASADDLYTLLGNTIGQCESALPQSPFMSLQRSHSISEATAQRYKDLARIRMRRRGKVKGLVETWERASTSGSECSASEEGSVSGSEAESENEVDREFESISNPKLSSESPSDLPPTLDDYPPHVRPPAGNPAPASQEASLSIPPPPYTRIRTELGVGGDQEEEPSIEELLASSPSVPLKGARAWEADFGLGETVKRIPVPLSADADKASRLTMEPEPDTSRCTQVDIQAAKSDSVRSSSSRVHRSTGSKRRSAHTRKRIVTAIFTGDRPDDVSKDAGGGAQDCRGSAVNGVARGTSAGSDPQHNLDSAIRALEQSVAATRAQLEAFKLRLEEVEADTTGQEELLTRAHSSHALKRQRSEADGPANLQTVDAQEDETFGTGNRDLLENISLVDIARALVAKALGWLYPYGQMGIILDSRDEPRSRTGSRTGANNRHRSPAKRDGGSSLAGMSCSIILFSFAICAVVLRRMGVGRWVRRP